MSKPLPLVELWRGADGRAGFTLRIGNHWISGQCGSGALPQALRDGELRWGSLCSEAQSARPRGPHGGPVSEASEGGRRR